MTTSTELPAPPAQPTPATANTPGLLALIFALVGAVLCWVAPIALLAWLFTLPAFVLGLVGVTRKAKKKGTSIAAIVISTVAFLVALISFSVWTAGQSTSATPNSTTAPPASSQVTAPPTTAAIDLTKYTEIGDQDFALLVKDPSSVKGKQFLLYGVVTQFDAASGKCNFLAATSNRVQTDAFGYLQNTWLTGGDGQSKCDLLKNVVQDNLVKLWVTGNGAYSYNTQAGGNTTVPRFQVDQVEIQPAR